MPDGLLTTAVGAGLIKVQPITHRQGVVEHKPTKGLYIGRCRASPVDFHGLSHFVASISNCVPIACVERGHESLFFSASLFSLKCNHHEVNVHVRLYDSTRAHV